MKNFEVVESVILALAYPSGPRTSSQRRVLQIFVRIVKSGKIKIFSL